MTGHWAITWAYPIFNKSLLSFDLWWAILFGWYNWSLGGRLVHLQEFAMTFCILTWPSHLNAVNSWLLYLRGTVGYAGALLWIPTKGGVQGSNHEFWKNVSLTYGHCSFQREIILWAATIWYFNGFLVFE